MADIQLTLDEIRDEFSIFSDPRDKYVYLVDLAKDTRGLSDEERVEENRIHGCTSQAWIAKEISNCQYSFRTDSDAMIVKGLLSLIERSFNGHTKAEILDVNGGQFLESVGLGRSISSQRTNGFSSAINKIQIELLD
jgi:cysteine desulfuration protein SufE|tara:strand:+ start:1799 stop:2209 length:411 start_codon:yes stop_codon:yes gene_type:complete